MSHTATIEGLSPGELFRIISNSRLSGVATIISNWKSGRVVFTWGRIVHASADGLDKLGECLISKGLVSRGDLFRALEAQERQGKKRPLGAVLAAMGCCDRATIGEVIVDQMKNAFGEIMSWDSGMVHFKMDDTGCASMMLNVALDTQALLLDAARRDDEARNGEDGPTAASDAEVEEASSAGEPVVDRVME